MALIILFVLAGLWFLPVGVGADSVQPPGLPPAAAPGPGPYLTMPRPYRCTFAANRCP